MVFISLLMCAVCVTTDLMQAYKVSEFIFISKDKKKHKNKVGVQQIVFKFLFFCFGRKKYILCPNTDTERFCFLQGHRVVVFFVAIIMTKLLLYDRKWLFLKMIKGVKVNILYLDTLELRKSSFTLPCGV